LLSCGAGFYLLAQFVCLLSESCAGFFGGHVVGSLACQKRKMFNICPLWAVLHLFAGYVSEVLAGGSNRPFCAVAVG
jgi:hypothetical protein